MDEIKQIKRSVYLREIQYAVDTGEYPMDGDLSLEEIGDSAYERVEEEYFIMVQYLKKKRACAVS